MFINDNWVIRSLSMAIQDVILIVGKQYGKYPNDAPDTASLFQTGVYRASKKDWVYVNPRNINEAYYNRVRARLNFSDGQFDENDLICTAEVLDPNASGIRLDYKNGLIYQSEPISGLMQLSYCYKKIKVITTWPESAESLDRPTISINSMQINNDPFAIGTDQKDDHYSFFIDVFAESDDQKGLILSILRQALKVGNLPLFNFGSGFPLTTRLEKDTSFDAVSQLIGYMQIDDFSITDLPKFAVNSAERHRASGKLIVSLIN